MLPAHKATRFPAGQIADVFAILEAQDFRVAKLKLHPALLKRKGAADILAEGCAKGQPQGQWLWGAKIVKSSRLALTHIEVCADPRPKTRKVYKVVARLTPKGRPEVVHTNLPTPKPLPKPARKGQKSVAALNRYFALLQKLAKEDPEVLDLIVPSALA